MQAAANNKHTQAPLTWQALQNQGVPVGYDEFAARWDSQEPNDQILHKLVDRFDSHGLVIKTKEKEIVKLKKWFDKNKLSLNVNKTKYIIFTKAKGI